MNDTPRSSHASPLNGYTLKRLEFMSPQCTTDFFRWCLQEKLYKSDAAPEDNSRMYLLYTGFEEFSALSAVVAYKGHVPVGLILCEHRDTGIERSPMENPDLSFHNLGFVNIYVKKSHRRQGLAQRLVLELEAMRLQSLMGDFTAQSCPFFVAQQLAKVIIAKTAVHSYAIGSDLPHRGRQMEIDNIAYHKTTQLAALHMKDNSLERKISDMHHKLNLFQVKPFLQGCTLLRHESPNLPESEGELNTLQVLPMAQKMAV